MKAKERREWKKWQKAVILMVVTSVIMSSVGCIIGLFVSKPMDDEQFKDCEIVAQQVYDQSDHGMVEVPQGYSIRRTDTEITVTKDGYSGKIKATLKDGNLVFEQTDRYTDVLCWSLGGIAVGLIVGCIIACKKGFIT